MEGKSSENCTIVNGAALSNLQVPEDRPPSFETPGSGGYQNPESSQVKPYPNLRRWADQRLIEWLLLSPIAPGYAIHALRGGPFLSMPQPCVIHRARAYCPVQKPDTSHCTNPQEGHGCVPMFSYQEGCQEKEDEETKTTKIHDTR